MLRVHDHTRRKHDILPILDELPISRRNQSRSRRHLDSLAIGRSSDSDGIPFASRLAYFASAGPIRFLVASV